MKVLSALSAAVFIAATVFIMSPEKGTKVYAAVEVGVTVMGSVGHFLVRRYIYALPDIQKTAVNTLCLVLSYGCQGLSILISTATILNLVAPTWISNLLSDNTSVSCMMFSIPEHLFFSLVCLALAVMTFFRNLRCCFPDLYLAANHKALSLGMRIGLPLIILIPYGVQVAACGTLCNTQFFTEFVRLSFKIQPNVVGLQCWAEVPNYLVFAPFLLVKVMCCIKKSFVFLRAKLIKLKSKQAKTKIHQSQDTQENPRVDTLKGAPQGKIKRIPKNCWVTTTTETSIGLDSQTTSTLKSTKIMPLIKRQELVLTPTFSKAEETKYLNKNLFKSHSESGKANQAPRPVNTTEASQNENTSQNLYSSRLFTHGTKDFSGVLNQKQIKKKKTVRCFWTMFSSLAIILVLMVLNPFEAENWLGDLIFRILHLIVSFSPILLILCVDKVSRVVLK